MLKHLPGQHNQKLHGSKARPDEPTLDGLMSSIKYALKSDNIGNTYIENNFNDEPVVVVNYKGFSAHISITDGHAQVIPQYNPRTRDWSDYTEDQIQNLTKCVLAIEKDSKAAGIKSVEFSGNSLPITMAADLGYEIYPTHYHTNDIPREDVIGFVTDTNEYLSHRYEISPIGPNSSIRLATDLLDSITQGITAENLLKIAHPDYPELPFYLENLMRVGRRSVLLHKLRYVKRLPRL